MPRKTKVRAGKGQVCTYLWAQEIHKRHRSGAREEHPDPDLPANVLEGDATSENGDEAEQPFAESAGCAAEMAEF